MKPPPPTFLAGERVGMMTRGLATAKKKHPLILGSAGGEGTSCSSIFDFPPRCPSPPFFVPGGDDAQD